MTHIEYASVSHCRKSFPEVFSALFVAEKTDVPALIQLHLFLHLQCLFSLFPAVFPTLKMLKVNLVKDTSY